MKLEIKTNKFEFIKIINYISVISSGVRNLSLFGNNLIPEKHHENKIYKFTHR